MAVGGVKGGGKGGKAGGSKGARGGSVHKPNRVDPTDAAGPADATSGSNGDAVGSLSSGMSNVENFLSPDFCAEIARTIPNWEGQVRALIAEVLRQNLRIESKLLTERIAETLQQDPRLKRKLERLLSKGS
jgi:hypothetical protein